MKIKHENSLSLTDRFKFLTVIQYFDDLREFETIKKLVVHIDPKLSIGSAFIRRRQGPTLKSMRLRDVSPRLIVDILNQPQYDIVLPNPVGHPVDAWLEVLIHEVIHLVQLDSGRLEMTIVEDEGEWVNWVVWEENLIPERVMSEASINVEYRKSLPWEKEAYSESSGHLMNYKLWCKEQNV